MLDIQAKALVRKIALKDKDTDYAFGSLSLTKMQKSEKSETRILVIKGKSIQDVSPTICCFFFKVLFVCLFVLLFATVYSKRLKMQITFSRIYIVRSEFYFVTSNMLSSI